MRCMGKKASSRRIYSVYFIYEKLKNINKIVFLLFMEADICSKNTKNWWLLSREIQSRNCILKAQAGYSFENAITKVDPLGNYYSRVIGQWL